MPRRKITPDKLRDALWELAQEGLSGLTHAKLSELLAVPTREVESQFPKESDMVLWLIYDVHNQVKPTLTFSDQDTQHDRLFETVMAYLDVLSRHQSAVQRLWGDIWLCPTTLLAIRPHHLKIVEEILRLADVEMDDLMGGVRLRAYGAFFLYVLYIWINDETSDQAKTMAAVDQGIRKLNEWGNLVVCGKG